MPTNDVAMLQPTSVVPVVPLGTADESKAKRGYIAEAIAPAQATQGQSTDPERTRLMIAEAAYYRAEKRGFAPGGELQDWLDAEAELGAKPG